MNEVAKIRTDLPAAPETDALPHNIEAEQQLLGAILTNNDTYDRIAALVKAEHFFDPVHARIFEIAAARIQKNALASPVTLKAFLEDDAGLKELGGAAYLVRLAGAAISAFAARDYAQMIYDLAVRRELIGLGRDISAKAAKIDVASEPREQITDAAGVAVVIEARHMCMMMRGVEKQNSVMTSSVMLGAFRDSSTTRQEFLQLIGRR